MVDINGPLIEDGDGWARGADGEYVVIGRGRYFKLHRPGKDDGNIELHIDSEEFRKAMPQLLASAVSIWPEVSSETALGRLLTTYLTEAIESAPEPSAQLRIFFSDSTFMADSEETD